VGDTQSTACAAALAALAAGRWEEWHGLGPACTRAAAEAGLGDTGDGPDGSGSLAGSPVSFRVYPPAPAAPHGVQLWLEGDRIVLVQINSPVLERDVEQVLGPPDSVLISHLGPRQRQWVYAGRGLTLHRHEATGEPRRLYGYAPTTAEEFAGSWLAAVDQRRVRRRR
jgi:hypothetical protein